MFQIRAINGAIRNYDDADQLLLSTVGMDEIEKLSFDAKDGTRIRLVHQGNGQFTLTLWSEAQMQYALFP